MTSSFWDKMPRQKGGEAVYRYRSKDTGLGAVSWRKGELLLLLQVARLPARGPTPSADPPEAGSPAKYLEDGGSEWIDLKVWIIEADTNEKKQFVKDLHKVIIETSTVASRLDLIEPRYGCCVMKQLEKSCYWCWDFEMPQWRC